MKTSKHQKLKEAIGDRMPDQWLSIIKTKLADETEENQKWTARVIVNNYPGDKAYFTTLDEFSDLYGHPRTISCGHKDQERAFNKIGLPYEESEAYRKQKDTRKYGRRTGANRRGDTYERIAEAENQRHSEASTYMRYHKEEINSLKVRIEE